MPNSDIYVSGAGVDVDPRLQRGPPSGERHVHAPGADRHPNGVDRQPASALGLLGAAGLRQGLAPLQVSTLFICENSLHPICPKAFASARGLSRRPSTYN